MAAIGGSVESISLDGRNFAVAADSEVTMKLGGVENELEPNGDGITARTVKTQIPWALSGLSVEVDHLLGDQEFLVSLQKGGRFFPVVISFADGSAYQGSGQITGEINSSSQKATAEINLMGPGELTKQ